MTDNLSIPPKSSNQNPLKTGNSFKIPVLAKKSIVSVKLKPYEILA
jgi:hypothetical protein